LKVWGEAGRGLGNCVDEKGNRVMGLGLGWWEE